MKCYFLRHGDAGDPGEWKGDDFERPLTGDGRKRMAREAKAMAELDLELDRIITSPLVRAKETAAIVAKALAMQDRLIEDPRLGLSFDPDRLQSVLREYQGARAIMLVGHEPGMSQTIGQLAGGSRIDFKKGSLARVDLADAHSTRGALVWLIPPKVLAL